MTALLPASGIYVSLVMKQDIAVFTEGGYSVLDPAQEQSVEGIGSRNTPTYPCGGLLGVEKQQ